VAFLRKMTCNWARGKRRGFSPGAAARHRGRTIVPANGVSELSFSIFSDIGHHISLFSDIGHHDVFHFFLRSDFTIHFLVMIRLHFQRFSDRTSPRSEIGHRPPMSLHHPASRGAHLYKILVIFGLLYTCATLLMRVS